MHAKTGFLLLFRRSATKLRCRRTWTWRWWSISPLTWGLTRTTLSSMFILSGFLSLESSHLLHWFCSIGEYFGKHFFTKNINTQTFESRYLIFRCILIPHTCIFHYSEVFSQEHLKCYLGEDIRFPFSRSNLKLLVDLSETRSTLNRLFCTKYKGLHPSQDSSVGSISAWYRGGPGFKSWQGQEFFNENK